MEIGNNKLSTHDMATAAERKVIPVEDKSPDHAERLTESKSTVPANGEELSPLLSAKEEADLRSRWNNIQTGFVDEFESEKRETKKPSPKCWPCSRPLLLFIACSLPRAQPSPGSSARFVPNAIKYLILMLQL
jgi:hypothetical protein